MQIISLTYFDLVLASLLVAALALLSFAMRLNLSRQLLTAAARTGVQLSLIGLVLKLLFTNKGPLWIILISLVMLFSAGREVMTRQKRRLSGWWGFGVGTLSMCISSFTITLFALTVIIHIDPWYEPRYAIPLLGMMLGNTMNGISIGLDRLTHSAWEFRAVIEGRLMLGQGRDEAIADIRRESIRSALIPITNSMAVAGLVSLPGMMTGQILAGNPPMEAVRYQILVMFLIAGGTGFGTLAAITIASGRLFDGRHRLRLDRLKEGGKRF